MMKSFFTTLIHLIEINLKKLVEDSLDSFEKMFRNPWKNDRDDPDDLADLIFQLVVSLLLFGTIVLGIYWIGFSGGWIL